MADEELKVVLETTDAAKEEDGLDPDHENARDPDPGNVNVHAQEIVLDARADIEKFWK